jgi:hypothetical protein
MKKVLVCLFAATALLLSVRSAQAASIEFEATNLGGDTWRYDYFIASGSFSTQQGFAVFFDYALYEDLQPAPSPAGWDVLTTNPDIVLQSDGTFDALALMDNPLFAGPFSVTFTWLGAGMPASQPFDFYTLDSSGFPVPDPSNSGFTTPRQVAPVPEPSTLLLVLTGTLGGWRLRSRRSASPSR